MGFGATACTNGASSPLSQAVITHYRGVPPGITGPPRKPDDGPFAIRLSDDQVAITTWGSGSCPDLPTSVTGHGAHEVDITTAEYKPEKPGSACTADLSPTTSTVKVTSGVDVAASLTLVVDGKAIQLSAR